MIKPRTTPTYNSAETGPAYSLMVTINDRMLAFNNDLSDPFCTHTVHVGVRDMLRGLFTGRLDVALHIGGEPQVIEDVLGLDAARDPGRDEA